ncbi:hypothetical protein UFOVP579_13 [uncultured Caudovirales phage]|uniref:Uncharacterized protein n=1 Tax=uncultured Caudovirales phage TaxID=2100421 RepID=A0A6J5LNC7_9CAUD|nr:hypothetical protein UFOVP302_13 [uncultured Caudovirales phage]CAB4168659.1 hypothetical protein UFOVP579_13 [uncultured Caudovirales phage]
MPEALNIIDTSWSGPAASYMITRAVVGADTIQKGCIYVEDGIRKKKTIPRIEVSNFMQKRTATPTSQGTVDVDGRVLEPQDLMLYYEFNPRDYESHFYAEMLQPKILGRELPVTAENFMMLQTMKRLNEFFENAIWRSRTEFDPNGSAVDPTTKGDTADASNYFYFDGLIKKALDANTGAYPTIVMGSPATLVSGTAGSGEENIGDALNRCYKSVPKALLYKYGVGGLKFLISYKTQQVYEELLTVTNVFKNNDTTEKGINRYKGYEIVALAGLPDNTIIVCICKPDIDSNLWLGINSTEDNQLQLMRLQNNSELFFVKGLFKMDTQIGFADQLVIYTKIVD